MWAQVVNLINVRDAVFENELSYDEDIPKAPLDSMLFIYNSEENADTEEESK